MAVFRALLIFIAAGLIIVRIDQYTQFDLTSTFVNSVLGGLDYFYSQLLLYPIAAFDFVSEQEHDIISTLYAIFVSSIASPFPSETVHETGSPDLPTMRKGGPILFIILSIVFFFVALSIAYYSNEINSSHLNGYHLASVALGGLILTSMALIRLMPLIFSLIGILLGMALIFGLNATIP